jgi:hypothetical protein
MLQPVEEPLCNGTPGSRRHCFVKAACAVAEGATVQSASSASACVSAVLGDAGRRVCVLGGREGMPRSIGSVYAGAITLFLGGLCGVVRRTFTTTRKLIILGNGIAITRDRSMLLITTIDHAMDVVSAADGALLCTLGGQRGDGPLQFYVPRQVHVAPDDFVFVAECGNNRLQVLTPQLGFHAFIGVENLTGPNGVCADDESVYASEALANRISVFCRRDGNLLRRFGTYGRDDGQLNWPSGLCFVNRRHGRSDSHGHIAVADACNKRVCVFGVDGTFVRHVGAGVFRRHSAAVACSAFGELIVNDGDQLALFDTDGELVKTFRDGCNTYCMGVAIFGNVVVFGCFSDLCEHRVRFMA